MLLKCYLYVTYMLLFEKFKQKYSCDTQAGYASLTEYFPYL